MTRRLLVDENFPIPSLTVLRQAGFDVYAIAEETPGRSDADVLALAAHDDRWLVTFDRDFGELVFGRGAPHPKCILYLRLTRYRPEEPGQLLLRILGETSALEGHFVVVEPDGLRLRALPTGG